MHSGTENIRVDSYPMFTDCYRNLAFKYPSLGMVLKGSELGPVTRILKGGIVMPVISDQSIRNWLTEDLRLPDNYVAARIRRVYLNHRPVEDLDEARLGNRDILALSATDPGQDASAGAPGDAPPSGPGRVPYEGVERRRRDGLVMIDVRVLDQLKPELGPPLLARGALISGERLASAFPRPDDAFWKRCTSLRLNRQQTDPETLLRALDTDRNSSFLFRLLLAA